MDETPNTQQLSSHVQETTNTDTATDIYVYTYEQTHAGKSCTQDEHSSTQETTNNWTHTRRVTSYESWRRQVLYQQVQLQYHFLPEPGRRHRGPPAASPLGRAEYLRTPGRLGKTNTPRLRRRETGCRRKRDIVGL